MRVMIFLTLAGLVLAGEPKDDAWEAKVLSAFSTQMADVSRIELGAVKSTDMPMIRLLASYAGFKAMRTSPEQHQVDSLVSALSLSEDRFWNRLRPYRANIERLASGAKPKPGDSPAIAAMAQYAKTHMDALNSQELVR